MGGLNMSYEYFRDFVPLFTRHSSSPTQVTDLNPIIQKLLTSCHGSSIYGLGGHSVLLQIADGIAAKVSFKTGGQHLSHEQAIFSLLEQTPSPHIVQSFLRVPDITFMQLLNNGTLYERMSIVDSPCPVLLWMQQLSGAVAHLESFGIAHCDINPRNILVDDEDQLKLVDLDHALEFGKDLDVGDEPYVRVHTRGEKGGTYGIAGPVSEQFALGSIFWYMTRGKELYAELEGHEQVNRLSDRAFPDTDPQDPVDSVIKDCWLGKFERINDLSKHIQLIAKADAAYQTDKEKYDAAYQTSKNKYDATYKTNKEQCEHYYRLIK